MTVLSLDTLESRNVTEESTCRVELQPAGPSGVRVLRLSGVPGTRNSRRVYEAMTAALLDEVRVIIIDVSGVDHLDGDGVMLLVLIRRQARRLGPTLPLAGAAPEVARSLRTFDLNGLFHLHATVHEAVRVYAARGGD